MAGKKKKAETTPEVQETQTTEESLMDSDRDSLYAQYEETQTTENQQGLLFEAGEEESKEEIPEETPEVTEPEQQTETPPEEGVAGEEKEEIQKPSADKKQTDPVRMVPYDALHQEREKRKSYGRELEETKGQLHSVLQDFKELTDTKDTEDGDDIATKREFKTLEQTNAELQRRLDTLENRTVQSEQAVQQKNLDSQIVEADKVLAEQGYPGFKAIGVDLVSRALGQIRQEKGVDEAAIYDNPTGWQQVYKKLFPNVRAMFSKQEKQELMDNKTRLKENANLATTPGRADKKTKKDEPWTYDDYLRMRKENEPV